MRHNSVAESAIDVSKVKYDLPNPPVISVCYESMSASNTNLGHYSSVLAPRVAYTGFIRRSPKRPNSTTKNAALLEEPATQPKFHMEDNSLNNEYTASD